MENKIFEQTNEKFQKIMNYEKMLTQSCTVVYRNKITDNDYSVRALSDLFKLRGARALVTAPTNSGKTYSVAEVFSQSFSNKGYSYIKYLNILVTPNRVQSLQNEKTYKLTSIVGGSKAMGSYNLLKDNSFSILPDKAREVLDFIDSLSSRTHINLCIDESHDLIIESREYRKNAINDLDELILAVQKKSGSVVMMTATPDALLGERFQRYLHFKPSENKPLADKFNFIKYDENKKMKDMLFEYMCEKIEAGFLPFVRLNDIRMAGEFKEKLLKRGIVAVSIDSTQKKSSQQYNVKTGELEDFFINPIFENVIKKSQLPATVMIAGKEEPIKAYFTTSMIEVGTNICSVGGDQNEKLFPVFVCQNSKDAKPTSVVQFFNRIRYHIEECALFVKNKNPNDMTFLDEESEIVPEFRDILKVCEKEYDDVKKVQADFTEIFKSHKMLLIPNKKMNEFAEAVLQLVTPDGEYNNAKCLDYDSIRKRVVLNTAKFRQLCFSKYTYQFYYFHNEFMQTLANETGMIITPISYPNNNDNDPNRKEINPIDTDKKKKNAKPEISTLTTFKSKQDFLKKISESPEGMSAFLKCAEITQKEKICAADIRMTNGKPNAVFSKAELNFVSESREFLSSKEGKVLSKIIKSGTDPLKATNTMYRCNESGINKLYTNSIKENCISTLDYQSRDALVKYSLNEISLKEISAIIGVDRAGKVFEICECGYKKDIAKAIRLKMPIEEIIAIILNNNSKNALNKAILKKQYHEFNRCYAQNEKHLLCGITGFEQSILLQMLYSKNENGNLVQRVLNRKTLSLIAEKLTQARSHKFKFKKYTIEEVLELCKYIFQLRKKDNCYSIVSLA